MLMHRPDVADTEALYCYSPASSPDAVSVSSRSLESPRGSVSSLDSTSSCHSLTSTNYSLTLANYSLSSADVASTESLPEMHLGHHGLALWVSLTFLTINCPFRITG